MAKKLEAIFQGEDKIESTLFVKEVPLTRFPECDLISRKDQYFNDKLEDFHQYCLENRSKYFRAGKLTDATPVRYTTRPTAVAFEAITGEKYTTVEFCGKAVANLYSAVCQRQFKPNTGLDPVKLQRFRDFVGAWHRDLLPKIREELEASREVFRNWNPLVELEARGFNRGKKMSYAETIIDELTGQSNPSDFYFTCFVKTGEQFPFTGDVSDLLDPNGRHIGSDRPRLVCPASKQMTGHMTLLPQLLYPILKRNINGFVQAMKCEQIEDIVMDAVQRGMVNVISTDASGFDSNCHRELKEIVCSPIEEAFMDAVEDMIMNGRFYTHMDEGLKRKLAKGLREAYLRRDFELIIPAPGIDLSYPLTQRQERSLKLSKLSRKDVVILTVDGTTPSGHCGTTLENTLLMKAYSMFDAYEAGIQEPWSDTQDDFRSIVSGDDCVRFVSPAASQALLAAVRGNSVDDIRELDFGPPKCLGQCLKKIELEHWSEMEFLSKVPFVHNDRIVLCRNYKKRFTTGLSYWGTHSLLLRYPALHVAAQWVGLKSEKASRLLEDLTSLNAMLTENQLQQILPILQYLRLDVVRYALRREDGYAVEDQLNHHLGIHIGSLYSMDKIKTVSILAGAGVGY